MRHLGQALARRLIDRQHRTMGGIEKSRSRKDHRVRTDDPEAKGAPPARSNESQARFTGIRHYPGSRKS
jgi:hypothetical protein